MLSFSGERCIRVAPFPVRFYRGGVRDAQKLDPNPRTQTTSTPQARREAAGYPRGHPQTRNRLREDPEQLDAAD